MRADSDHFRAQRRWSREINHVAQVADLATCGFLHAREATTRRAEAAQLLVEELSLRAQALRAEALTKQVVVAFELQVSHA